VWYPISGSFGVSVTWERKSPVVEDLVSCYGSSSYSLTFHCTPLVHPSTAPAFIEDDLLSVWIDTPMSEPA